MFKYWYTILGLFLWIFGLLFTIESTLRNLSLEMLIAGTFFFYWDFEMKYSWITLKKWKGNT